ncbi:oligopeptide/dipeptide ABC transporter, ATPase subunit [Thermaerobacter marianensis DSM 12885]|uniref:Oligopeptide/dipeptide ABC transporter, ATPase subunit n=1 Tax=Thermaerobacter marianensis (strain ATCC 700841 / DSM 12885 / JCM 10246 / 7p75a) TaxID=644966 RepID=E6SMF6_THEM7|nr:ABC transporter ATP-binding protein [Thermaerobacter marianensis]ADU50416.1 oligopeptide/dipeptide ABC transporter, ATPase subunit [Thermaerobacter marianensis DSM 12885]
MAKGGAGTVAVPAGGAAGAQDEAAPGERPLLEVRNLKRYFDVGRGAVLKAVDGVSFSLRRGEVLGLVGESGCGKSTVGRTIVRLYDPTEGQVLFDGQDVHKLAGKDLMRFRRRAQMIFQDPYASLNPRMLVSEIIGEALDLHGMVKSRKERTERIHELLNLVGLNRDHANRFPHEFSGGQRQRIGIARALAVKPEFIVADEPISALDVSIQAQIVNLMTDLKEQFGLTYIFIAHDLSMVKHISDRVAVMYLGQIMELAPSDELYHRPQHPYTQALLSAVPIPDPHVERTRERIVLKGDVPSPVNPPRGCPFSTRCPLAEKICFEARPPLEEIAPGHWAACHLVKGTNAAA